MRIFRNLAGIAILSLLFLTPYRAVAGEPTTQLRTSIDQFVTILTNTSVAELRASGLPQKALNLIFGRFDFAEMTKRSLGQHWVALNPGERREFVDAFTQRLLRAYGRSMRANGDEKIEYGRENLDGEYATVETKVISGNGEELPVAYQLHVINGQWKVYDVVIDSISIVNNYRAQFERVITKTSIKELLRKMQQDS
ncbi:MAG: phospholipid-binding protein MlaC [Chloroflexota bacterium]